jgi:hypothetical protein
MMKESGARIPGYVSQLPLTTTRRQFLRLSAFGILGATAVPAMAERVLAKNRRPAQWGSGNTLPGRIVIGRDGRMGGHLGTIDKDWVEQSVHRGVRDLTGIADTGAAFESLFPGLGADSTFAIKINLIGPCDTRWETARAVVSGLSLMLGGTYDVSQVTVFDRHSLPAHGYTDSEFIFNGNTAVLSSTNNASGSGYYIYGAHELSRYILNADYVINIPVLKSHTFPNNQITIAFKNHYGSCASPVMCNDVTALLTVNADTQIRDKTCLVVTDALRATYDGDPVVPPMVWDTYFEGTPNTLLITTDPTTNEYIGRDIINRERAEHGMAAKPAPWVEQSSADPCNIGVSNPDDITIIEWADVEDEAGGVTSGTFLGPNTPNPFSDATTLRLRLANPGRARLKIFDARGRLIRQLSDREFPGGFSEIPWDGRDSTGGRVVAGVYFVRLEVGRQIQTRRIVLVR